MRSSKSFYYPSTAPGKTWSISVHKPQGRPAFASAWEGEVKDHGEGADRFQSFSFVMFQARSLTQPIVGPATMKKRKAAFQALLDTMHAQGLIDTTGATGSNDPADQAAN